MAISEYARDSYQLIIVTGVLDGKTDESAKLCKLLDRAPESVSNHYMIDLEKVEYVNSSMLGLLVKFLSICQDAGKNLILVNPSSSIMSIFDMIGLTQIMSIAENEDQGCKILGIAPQKPISKDIDYDILSDEIEDIINSKGMKSPEKNKDGGELRKLLGGL